jgi:dynein heavy chain
MSEYVQK